MCKRVFSNRFTSKNICSDGSPSVPISKAVKHIVALSTCVPLGKVNLYFPHRLHVSFLLCSSQHIVVPWAVYTARPHGSAMPFQTAYSDFPMSDGNAEYRLYWRLLQRALTHAKFTQNMFHFFNDPACMTSSFYVSVLLFSVLVRKQLLDLHGNVHLCHFLGQ